MQYGESSDPPQLSQSAYTLMASFSSLTITLLGVVGLSLLFFIIAADYANSKEDKFMTIYFLFFFTIILLLLLWYLLQTRKFSKYFKIWKKSYFDQTYTIIFNTTIPKGDNEITKILYLSNYIFPQLRYDYIKYSTYYVDILKYFIKSKLFDLKKIEEKRILKAMNYKVNGYTFDFALKTDDGYFIIKNFDDKIVTISDIKQLIDKAKSRFKTKYQRIHILRILIVAKNYDKAFPERGSLEEIMTKEIKSKLKIDLIVKENIGYSLLWISPYI